MNFMPAAVEGATLHLPIGDIKLTREMADEVQGHDILIAGARPEHFEDASMLDDARKAEGLTFEAHVDDRVAGQRAVRLHPLRGSRGGAGPAPGAGV
jgi:hypothetical protein